MKLFNTLTQTLEPFVDRDGEVSLYVCGITPYDTTHLGHAFTYSVADLLVRHLEGKKLDVCYVQNVTDIDDDILKKAGQAGEDWKALGNRWTRHFILDMQALNIRPPDYYPRATEFIEEIIDLVKDLVRAGVAYESGGSVYYAYAQWLGFGKLSKLPAEAMLVTANERGNHPEDPHKRNPLDFVLWQAQIPGEPAWDSPWGAGRPGWHIECSTMATQYLGKTIDIHSGGADLCFPHHECEIAQVEPVNGQAPFVRYWLHVAMVRHDGEKMSKSLGNLVMVRDLLKRYTADGLRLYLAGHHYRDSWTYNERKLQKAEELATLLKKANVVPGGKRDDLSGEAAWASFSAALDNDLDSPKALEIIAHLGQTIVEAAAVSREVEGAQEILRKMAGVLGLTLHSGHPERRVISGWQKHLEKFQD